MKRFSVLLSFVSYLCSLSTQKISKKQFKIIQKLKHNIFLYWKIHLLLLLCFTIYLACKNEKENHSPADLFPPNVSTSEIGYSKHLRGFQISWVMAEDDSTKQSNLKYKVAISKDDNISTVENINTFDITDLDYQESYFFNVIVKDIAGNKMVYTRRNDTTDINNNSPTAEISGHPYSTITSSGVYAVQLNAKNSYDTDTPYDSVSMYKWDTDNDGLFGSDDTNGSINIGNATSDANGIEITVSNDNCQIGNNVNIELKVFDE